MRRVQGRDQVTRQVGKLRQGRKIKKGLKEVMMGTVCLLMEDFLRK